MPKELQKKVSYKTTNNTQICRYLALSILNCNLFNLFLSVLPETRNTDSSSYFLY